MKIESIKPSGSNNILKWSIDNGADLLAFDSLRDLVNDETYYLVTISDVNFFEVFRLVQTYREKLRILSRGAATIPEISELDKYFPNEIHSQDNKESMKLSEMVHMTAEAFMNIALQMNADNDIITPETVQLYSSMIALRYTVQFPLSFLDFISAFKNSDEISEVFNEKYPEGINDIFDTKAGSNIKMMIELLFIRNTSIIKYGSKFEQLIDAVKYAPLKKVSYDNKLYKYALSSFYKYENISRSEIRCTLFKADKSEMAKTIERMKKISTPIKASFVVQMPIYYMMMIENSFSRAELPISYEASMSSIISGDIKISDFITPTNIDDDSENVQNRINAISAYKTRIEEANSALLNLIPILIAPENECDITNTFALLPSIYSTKAVITVDPIYEEKYTHHFDSVVCEFFKDLMYITNSILK